MEIKDPLTARGGRRHVAQDTATTSRTLTSGRGAAVTAAPALTGRPTR